MGAPAGEDRAVFAIQRRIIGRDRGENEKTAPGVEFSPPGTICRFGHGYRGNHFVNDDSAETYLARLAAMQKELRPPVNAILALGKTLHEEAVASGIDGIMPDVERIIASSKTLSDVVDSLAADDAAEAFLFDQPAEEVARTVRHELRTPIAGIKGYGEILLEDLEDLGGEALRPILLKLLTKTNLLLKQLNVIVDFSNP